ncbi:MAG: type IX secretion system membrane protein PorP/SprF [Breznakibacter sp.]
MKIFVATVVFTVAVLGLKAQNLTQYNHYIANQGLLNPAYNGTRDVISGLMLHRSQWVGFEGAPMNEALNVHGAIEDTNLGVGVSLMNDKIGMTNTFDLFGAASYKFRLNRKGDFMSLGLQLGVSSFVLDGTKAVMTDYDDPALQYTKYSKINMNVGFGAYYYSEQYFGGFSIPKFFHNKYSVDQDDIKNKLDFKNTHMYLYGGYAFEWGDVVVKPTLLSRIVYGAPLQFDVSGSVLLMQKLWLGLSYRTTSEMAFLTEYIINRQFTVRYSFDYPFSSINNYGKFGSHELSLQFDFTFNKRPGMRSIRYF